MSKIFIFADAIGTYTALHIIEFLINIDIDTVIITDERVYGGIVDDLNFRIDYYQSIDSCVFNSDFTIIFNKKCLPNKTIVQIRGLCSIQNKMCFEISENNSLTSNNSNTLLTDRMAVNPSVLIISIGHSTIPIKSELTINHIIHSSGAKTQQIFSQYSIFLLKQLQESLIMSTEVEIDNNNADVNILFLDLENNITNLNSYHKMLYDLKPDYVMVLVDYDFQDYNLLSMYLKCICLRNADIVIKSRWFSIGNNMFCHSDSFMDKNKSNLLDFEDKDFYDKIKFDLLSKISLGEGITRIH